MTASSAGPPQRWSRTRWSTTRAGPLSLVLAFLRRDWGIAWSYRTGFATDVLQSITSVFFLYFLGRLVGSRGHSAAGGLAQGYFPFVVIGVALLGIVTTGLTAVSTRLRTDQTTGTLEALLAMPSPAWLTVLGSASYQLVYAAASAALTVVIAVVGFGLRFHATLASAALAAAGLAVSVGLFCVMGLAFAAFIVVFKRGGQAPLLVGTAFSLLGGVYYPVSLLPGPLRLVSDLLPFTWSLQVVRRGLLEAQLAWGAFGILILSVLVLVPASLWLFTVAVARSRRTGTLGQY